MYQQGPKRQTRAKRNIRSCEYTTAFENLFLLIQIGLFCGESSQLPESN